LDLDTRLARLPEAIDEPAGADRLVLDLDSGRYFALGEVGGLVWSRLDGRRTLGEIADEVAATWDVTLAEARRDVVAFARELAGAGLARPVV
jgi:hypothetical protein